MTQVTNKNHFSPVMANKRWTNEEHCWKFKQYYYCENRRKVVEAKRKVGKSGWGYEFDLYSQSLENRLGDELENQAEVLYEKLIKNEILNAEERMKWGQFIVTQAVRTPSFFKYRDYIENSTGGDFSYKNSIIGCSGCKENKYIACRNWVILEAHDDDFFVRTDNPIYMTGFLETPSTTVFYPLSPKKCFVACSMPKIIPVFKGQEVPFPKQEVLKLEKGDAYHINFELIKSANKSLILALPNNNEAISIMNLEILGNFPQIPFLIFSSSNELDSHYKLQDIIALMSKVDGVKYPYREYPFNPFYGIEFSMGINPFSIFGVIDEELGIGENNT